MLFVGQEAQGLGFGPAFLKALASLFIPSWKDLFLPVAGIGSARFLLAATILAIFQVLLAVWCVAVPTQDRLMHSENGLS